MAWTEETIEVGTSATAIKPADPDTNVAADKVVFRTDSSEAIYLGGSTVTTSTGVPLDTDTVYELDLSNGAPYLVAASATDHNFAFGSPRR